MIKPILRFTKIEHTAFSLPLLFTGAWLGAGQAWPPVGIVVLIVLAATGARVYGMALNRIIDHRIDAQNPRTAQRELPSGVMNLKTAGAITLTGLVAYLSACAILGPWCLVLSPLPLIPLTGYSFLKRFTVLCHFGIGLCLAMAPLGAYVATAGHPCFSPAVVVFSLFVFFWLSGADIIYAILDIQHDRKNGIFSIPACLGADRAQAVSAGLHFAALMCLVLMLMLIQAGSAAVFALIVTAFFMISMYLPFVPVEKRFFPLATLAGVAGAITPLLA